MPATSFSFGPNNTTFTDSNFVLQEAISAYSDEAYTNARKLSGTGIVGSNPLIDTNTETYSGQIRWFKPMNPTINVASLTDAADGIPSDYSSEFLNYIKTVRTYGGNRINLTQVVTQQDGLAKIGRDFGEHRAQDEHNAILSVLKGVAISEVLNGVGLGSSLAGLGGQTWSNDPTDKRYGFYVDLGSDAVANKLTIPSSATSQGAARAENLINAFGIAYKDYEPDYAYLIVSPEVFASFRSANLVDQDRVRDGNIEFNTIFQGKFRIIQTRSNQSMLPGEITKLNTGPGPVKIAGTKTSFIVLPGALAMARLAIPEPVEIERKAAAYKGGGITSIWNRWGYVLAPAGYDWEGPKTAFPSDTDYTSALDGSTLKTVSTLTDNLVGVKGVWGRKFHSALSLGILPVFHT
jgi:hypothetical protein